jgi:hypothetical protein
MNGLIRSKEVSSMRWLFSLLLLSPLVAACAPAPKNVPCSNQSDCKQVDPTYGYCVENRCVECLDDTSCGEGNACVGGRCQHKCQDGRQCAGGQICSDGYCSNR